MQKIREMKLSKFDWNRFQVGIITSRKNQYPVYSENRDEDRVVSHVDGISTSPIFHLKGWGATEAMAKRMAGIKS